MTTREDRTQILTVLNKVMDLEKKKEGGADNALLHQERLLLLSTEYMANGLGYAEVPFDFSQYFVDYTMTVNKQAMEQFNLNNNEQAIHFLLKAIDLLMNKSIHKFVRPLQKYGEMKVLTFNNLACIYQKRRQFALALKSVSFAVDLEEKLVSDNFEPAKTSIVSTLINKAAIQSSLNKHDKSQESLFSALLFIEKRSAELSAEDKNSNNQGQENGNNNNQNPDKPNDNAGKAEENNQGSKDNTEELKTLKQLKMMCYYNIGAEDEHLFHSERAKQNYSKSKAIAEELSDQTMKDRLQKIIDSLR